MRRRTCLRFYLYLCHALLVIYSLKMMFSVSIHLRHLITAALLVPVMGIRGSEICAARPLPADTVQASVDPASVVNGDARTDMYLPKLQGRRVLLFSNKTGEVRGTHVLDILLRHGVNVVGILSPEHGFRGTADAGEEVASSTDATTGLPIYSLYGAAQGRPADSIMAKADLVVTDIQDVGLRFYTYYITMYHIMEACADHDKEMMVLDRANPNGFYVDGPLLQDRYRSGVGALPIPVVHGMTLGELARMINGERWLPSGKQCRLTVVPCLSYTHATRYHIDVAPSPNLPNMKSIYLYPSLCLLEGTVVSLGRGTDKPFQVYGHPGMKGHPYTFTPRSMPGAKHPPLCDQQCHGVDLSTLTDSAIWAAGLNLSYVIDAYRSLGMGDKFFTPFFERLIGVGYVRQMIEQGCSAAEIESRWQHDVATFKQQRKPYLLYPDLP